MILGNVVRQPVAPAQHVVYNVYAWWLIRPAINLPSKLKLPKVRNANTMLGTSDSDDDPLNVMTFGEFGEGRQLAGIPGWQNCLFIKTCDSIPSKPVTRRFDENM